MVDRMSGRVLICSALIIVFLWSSACAVPPCNQIILELTPCMAFLRRNGSGSTSTPGPLCCTGIEQVSPFLIGQPDRTAVCDCLLVVLSRLTGFYDPDLVPDIPSMCGYTYVYFPPIDFNTVCTRY